MKVRVPRVKAKDVIHDWHLFPGDEVQVIGGPPKLRGQTGKIVASVKKMNAVVIDGVNMAKKHIRPNPIQPRGSIVSKPMPVNYSDVQILDPVFKQPTPARLIKVWDAVGRKMVPQRFLELSQTHLPLPKRKSPIEPYDESKLDTPKDFVSQVTFQASIMESPFPPMFWNQLERSRRNNQEGQAL
ncbi:translation protein SH3-like domain-containing protein [Zopfochytrium polystomum]|nr:translation protein SH3-like domain-containing protein [Zopfochytrium polystomum]